MLAAASKLCTKNAKIVPYTTIHLLFAHSLLFEVYEFSSDSYFISKTFFKEVFLTVLRYFSINRTFLRNLFAHCAPVHYGHFAPPPFDTGWTTDATATAKV